MTIAATWRSAVFPVVGGVAVALFLFSSVPGAYATSYCGQTSGVEQGGFTGNTATISVNVRNGQRLSEPTLTITGVVNSVLGMSQWAVDAGGRCTAPPGANYERATIRTIRVQLNGDFANCATGVSCSRNGDGSRMTFSRAVTLRPGANTIHLQAHHAYDRYFINQGCNGGGILCTLGTRRDPAIRDITVFYDPPAPVPVQLSAQCGTGQTELAWSTLSAGSDRNDILRSVDSDTLTPLSHALPLSTTSYTDRDVSPGHTYRYVFQNCADAASCRSNEIVCAPSIASGRIGGVCEWANDRPQVRVWWSPNAPPPTLATTNVLEKGDAFSFDPSRYWGELSNEPARFAYTDTQVELNTQYQYRIKYRPDLPSANTFNVFVSAATCDGPSQPNALLAIIPTFQSVKPNVSAVLVATGGTGIYEWEAPEGVISGSGAQISVTFINPNLTAVTRFVTVRSGDEQVTANVQVDGVETLQDSINLLGPGDGARISIAGGADTTGTQLVTLTLAHGFTDVATSSVTMQFANSLSSLADAPVQPFVSAMSDWDLCTSSITCTDGSYQVFANFNAPDLPDHGPVFDDIVYRPDVPESPASVLINNGAAQTTDRTVTLTLWHGFDGVSDGDILVQLADRADALAEAYAFPYHPSVVWDLCDGELLCPDGTGRVFARFIHVPDGRFYDASDSILYDSPWPDWGVHINDDATTTESSNVHLRLNPMFDVFGAEMSVSNLPELSDAVAVPYLETVAWDLCDRITGPCGEGTELPHAVYVQFSGLATSSWPGPRSPVYRDNIIIGDIPTPTPTPTLSPTPSPTATLLPIATAPPPGPTGSGPGILPSPTERPLPSWVPGPIADIIQVLSEAIEPAQEIVGPLSVASATAVAVSAVVAVSALAGSSSAASVASATWQWLLGLLGLLPKRKKVWGTVYDAQTKRPIPFARVQLMDRNRRVLETRVADKDGRYGFLATPESLHAQNLQITIAPSASGYTFPSHTGASIDTFVYNNLYYGDLITVSQDTLVNFDIPMDPVRPSTTLLLATSPSIALGAMVAAVADAGFWIGLVIVPLHFVLMPSPFTFGTLCLFLGAASLRIWGMTQHPFGTTVDAQTGRPMPFALITLNDRSGRRVAFAVSDEYGRWVMTAKQGTYKLQAVTPATVQPPRQTRDTIKVKEGWITRKIKL